MHAKHSYNCENSCKYIILNQTLKLAKMYILNKILYKYV